MSDGGKGAAVRFSLRTLMIVVTAVAALAATVIKVHGLAAEAERQRELARIRQSLPGWMELLGQYITTYSKFLPPDHEPNSPWRWPPRDRIDATGAPCLSWRASVESMLVASCGCYEEEESEEPTLNFAAAWNSSQNRAYSQSEGNPFALTKNADTTQLFAIVGPEGALTPGYSTSAAELPPDVILVLEVADSKTDWMQPGDYITTDLLAHCGKIGDHLHGLLPDRLHVLFADGEVWALDPAAPIADLQPFLTITGAKSHDRERLLGPHKVD
jgi:hypothetical protein